MIEIKLKGGMGNQMFQYATGRSLGLKYKIPVTLNTEYFINTPLGDTKREYQLDLFNIDKHIKIIDAENPIIKIIQKILQKFIGDRVSIFMTKLLLSVKLPVYLNGFFQNEKYFNNIRHILVKEFTLVNKISAEAERIKHQLESSQSVAINVRRGDYLRPDNIKLYGTCDIKYYNNAVTYIRNKMPNPLFCIFSDDQEWVKNEFKMSNAIFAGNDTLKDYEQMYLMTICKHNIIANSTFSWWGAWLNQNPDKIVIAPRQWMVDKTADELDILPKDWMQI